VPEQCSDYPIIALCQRSECVAGAMKGDVFINAGGFNPFLKNDRTKPVALFISEPVMFLSLAILLSC
jgi:hypothetical protein